MRALVVLLLFCGFMSSAAAQELSPGDTIHISVWQDPKLDQTIVVAPDGMIGFPLAGHIKAGGMTPQAVENELKRRLQKNYNGKLDITVSLAAANPDEQALTKPRFYVTGEVLKPGPFAVRPNINVSQAIAMAGGLGPFAAKSRIQVHREDHGVDSISLFDYNAYLAGTGAAGNINLRAGDTVIVPERELFE